MLTKQFAGSPNTCYRPVHSKPTIRPVCCSLEVAHIFLLLESLNCLEPNLQVLIGNVGTYQIRKTNVALQKRFSVLA